MLSHARKLATCLCVAFVLASSGSTTAGTYGRQIGGGSSGGGGGGSATTSHMTFAAPNSVGSSINTWEWLNQFSDNTAGVETAPLTFTFPILGVQVPLTMSAINARGAQSTNVSGSTPTATLPARTDIYTINVTQNATLTVAGLDGNTDAGYDFDYSITPITGTEIDVQVNGDNTGLIKGQYCAATCNPYPSGHLTISDTGVVVYVGHIEIRNVASSAHKFFRVSFANSSFSEVYWGYTTATSLTSVAFPNVGAGSSVTVQRTRPVAN